MEARANNNDKVVSTLKELALFIEDGNRGYKKAADETGNTALKSFCLSQSEQRQSFLNELNSIITLHGGKPEHSGTVKGALYRQFMDVKAGITGSDDVSVINSCIFGEEWAIRAVHDALDNDLPADVRSVVEKQHSVCHSALNQLKAMKDQYRSTSA
jgi:uncharacterized protein (TIGR02284 family)